MKRFIFKILRLTGLPYVFRELIQKDKVSILLFHELNISAAEKTFSYLSKNYNIIDLNDFIQNRNNQTKIPKKALIITFDDGHISNYQLISVFQKYKIPVTIFLCTEIINSNRHFWFRYKDIYKLKIDDLKIIPNKKRLALLNEIGFDQEMEFEYPQALQKEQILEMSESINMQSHTMFHPCLPKCTDSEAKYEIAMSKEKLEKDYSFRINAFAYPNGDYSDREIQLLKETGYSCGVTVDSGFNTLKTDLFRLKRLSVNDTSDLNELIVKSSGLWAFFKSRNGKTEQLEHF